MIGQFYGSQLQPSGLIMPVSAVVSEQGGSMLFNLAVRFLRTNEKGQDAAEYALLLALIALVIIIAVTAVGLDLSALYDGFLAAFP